MALYLIGLGLDNKEITEKGLEALGKVEKAYAEFYTNTETVDIKTLEEETGTKINRVSRKQVEQQDLIVESAKKTDTAFLVSGDPVTATTHYEIANRAKNKGIDTEIIHAPSIFTSVAETGLSIYKFGRTVTLPKQGEPKSITKYIGKNDSIGLHTLVLLDIDYNAAEAAKKLLDIGVENRETILVERANNKDHTITKTTLKELLNKDIGPTPHSIILTGEKSHTEQDFLDDL